MDYQLTHDIIRAALDAAEPRPDYARQTAETWLQAQPGHLTVTVLMAEALAAGGERRGALSLVRDVLRVDPENVGALGLAGRLAEASGQQDVAWAAAAALRQVQPGDGLAQVKLTSMAGREHNQRTRKDAQPAGASFLALIPALAELERAWRAGELDQARREATTLLAAHPHLVKAHLILADCLMAAGEELQAVEHLHQAAGLDPGGEVAQRVWRGTPPYSGVWPSAAVAGSPGPLPHAVAGALGLNLLPDAPARSAAEAPANGNGKRATPARKDRPRPAEMVGERVAEPPVDPPVAPPLTPAQEMLIDIQAELRRLNGRSKQGAQRPTPQAETETRVRLQPIYALVANRKGLQNKYGQDGWQQIDAALQALARAAENRLGLPSGVVYIDDAESLASFELEPVDPADAWAVKSLFQQMDGQLAKQEKEIGWLLLVGGPDLIAFHRLPNPAHDSDVEVLSDNPYGCSDDNYFLPRRAVGRMPDGAGSDPTLLLQSISTALAAQNAARRARSQMVRRWWEQLIWLFRGRRQSLEASFGYSASVWRKASLEVFKRIGQARQLRISPPLTADEFDSLTLGPARYAYFNLHGIEDGPAWYGQRDPTFPADYPDYPVALRPQDVGTFGTAPEVVFSEACYGAFLPGKTADTALSLKFLAAGAQMVVGSTCIAYGGLNAPLEGADLLASFFWQELVGGRSGGGALQQAKLALAEYLDGRQGYLDGEDQKTLISFIYLGDPTLPASPQPYRVRPGKGSKTWAALVKSPPRVVAKGEAQDPADIVAPELAEQIRTRVAGYLPGMEKAKMMVARQRVCPGRNCNGHCESCAAGAKTVSATSRMVITLQKTADVAGEQHEQLVKVTVDEAGQMLKLAVSK